MLLAAVILAACGGGAATSGNQEGSVTAVCDPGDASTFDECGTVMVALTDANGDFLNYTVDVPSLRWRPRNGRVVETLPRSTRINFSEYVDLTELGHGSDHSRRAPTLPAPLASTTATQRCSWKSKANRRPPWSRMQTAT